jgi:phosphopantetheinyl transferase (holo-ACP synthase)
MIRADFSFLQRFNRGNERETFQESRVKIQIISSRYALKIPQL